MEILWSAPHPLKPSQIKSELKDNHAYTTISTVLKRMSDKKMVRRFSKGKYFVYSPQASKNQFIQSCLCQIYQDLVGQYGRLAVGQFAKTIKTQPSHLKTLNHCLSCACPNCPDCGNDCSCRQHPIDS